MYKILVIDDEIEICKIIEKALSKDGYEITIQNKVSSLSTNQLQKFDLILLDVMMPDTDGFTFCKKIRNLVDCPIIFLTAKVLEQDVLEGLTIGGDDYIKKPFSLSELRARIKAHIRREHRSYHQRILLDNLCLDLAGKQILVDDVKIPLTKSEYDICEFLIKNRGHVFSNEQILEQVLGFDCESDISAIREHIKNIRNKLAKVHLNPIETVWGIGYKWN